MTVPPAAPQPSARAAHAWQRNARLWDFHFGVVLVVAELFVAFSHGPGLWVWLMNGWLLLSVPLYAVIGRPALHGDPENSRRAIAFCAGMAVLYTPAAILAQEASVAMVALAPLSYMLLDRTRAMTFLLIYNIAPLGGWMFLMWDDPGSLLRMVLIAVVVAGSSMSIGGWVESIVVQSTERAELICRLDESRDELTRLSVAHGALLERERLAREIHDTLAQGFTSLVMLSQALEGELERNPEQARRYVDLMQRTARENLAESRSLLASLAPAQLDDSSLDDAVRRLGERLVEELGIEVDCQVSGAPCELPPAVEVVALRATQEALSNIRKHAHASRVELLLAHTDLGLELTVRDNGRGFVTTAGPGRGYGLPGMRARVAEVGGTTELTSAPGEGTRLTVRLTVAACPRGAYAPTTPLQEARR
ncbi:sensor histidine kinase [Streptomyces sp. NPDC058221]|uniref:sensor histidine kinase n=1 Tax=Streptomyces sp. NPDC058221 TaxID=3346388 RepID=UPI0036ED85DB